MTRFRIGLSMNKPWVLMLLALCSCAIDDRRLKIVGACVTPPVGGLVSDFSAARQGRCSAQICPTDVDSLTVSLGVGDLMGLVFPYRSAGLEVITLTPMSTTSIGDAAVGQALRAAMVSGSPPTTPAIAHDGFALQFLDNSRSSTLGGCIDTSDYSAVSFTADGNLGNCPLRFAAQFNAGTFSTPCPLDECVATSTLVVAGGTTTLSLPDSGGLGRQTTLAGMQWEFSVPTDRPGGCTADFTIDDIRLVSAH